MKKHVSLDKMSKKAQREYYKQQRCTWNGINPVTRTVPNGKGYDRNKLKQEDRRSGRGYAGDDRISA